MEEMIYIISIVLGFFGLYGLVLVLAGSLLKSTPKKTKNSLPSIKVLLPAYKPDRLFIAVLGSLRQAIKNHNVEVFILFQDADEELVEDCKKFKYPYVEKSFSHLPGNSYQHALNYLCDNHLHSKNNQYTLILDKDNIIKSDFFDKLSEIDLRKYDVLQGARKPLETNQGLQLHDAISERYNDLMLREGKQKLGGVLEISGSAALIKTKIFKKAIRSLDSKAPGFDKNFMVNILSGNKSLKTLFQKQLMVFEEKTINAANYQAQRIRWFGEQYYNALFHFKTLMWSFIKSANFSCLDYWLTVVRPPRSIQLVLSGVLFVYDLMDLSLSIASLPFAFNSISFAIVAAPLLKDGNLKKFIVDSFTVLVGNTSSSLQSLRAKYLGTFVHTR